MKKHFTYLISAIIAVSFVFVSCSEDENGNNYNDNGYYNGGDNGYEPPICPPDCNDECCYEPNGNGNGDNGYDNGNDNGNDTIPAPQTLRINYSDWIPNEGARPDTINFNPDFGGEKFDEFNGDGPIVVIKTNPNSQINVTDRTIEQMQTPVTNKPSGEYTFLWTQTPTVGVSAARYIGDGTGTNWGLQILKDQPAGHQIFVPESVPMGYPRFVPIQDPAYRHSSGRVFYSLDFFNRINQLPRALAFHRLIVVDLSNFVFTVEDVGGVNGSEDRVWGAVSPGSSNPRWFGMSDANFQLVGQTTQNIRR